MKAALNGGLNLSILDGWWNEYYDGENGWAIPTADSVDTPEERDQLESEALYDLIEHQVAPRFYDRNAQGVPERWTQSIRHTLSTLSPQLSAERMVREYAQRLYLPAAAAAHAVIDGDYAVAASLSEWKERERAAWPSVAVVHVESGGLDDTPQVGDELQVRARVNLGSLTPDDVSVQVVYGHTTNGDQLADARTVALTSAVLATTTTPITVVTPGAGAAQSDSEGLYGFSGTVVLERAGSFGYTVRVVPRHEHLASSAELGLIAAAR
ncbi:MAG: glycogen phosphorylase [Subtercola sp.]|nr:glycogen phosphorylase [Subtercola sp.]